MLTTGPGSECITHPARQHHKLIGCFLLGGVITRFLIGDFIVLVSQLLFFQLFCGIIEK